jgi:diguanylate cyclase (GGDEF)-like protein
MNEMLPLASAVLPAAGWGLHALRLRRQLNRARRDPLTGLPGREVFEVRAARLLRSGPAAVVMADLDGFKALNDTHGHAAGDEAIRAAGASFHDAVSGPAGGIAARLGGDEFAAVVPTPHAEAMSWLLRGLHDELTAPTWIEGRVLTVGASVGGCWTGDPATPDLSTALRRADEVMYLVKRGGGGWLPAAPGAPALPSVHGRRIGRDGAHCEGRAA